MIVRSKFNIQILTLSFAIISASIIAVCYYLLQFVDLIVHGDLYGYGLVFSYDWANQYWNYSTLIRNSFLICILLNILTIVLITFHIITSKNYIKPIIAIFITTNIFFVTMALFSLTQIDFIVNNSLYNYGLQFSYDWSISYWNTLLVLFGLMIATIIIDAVSVLITLTSESWFSKSIRSLLRINSLMFFAGIMILFLSVNFNSSVLAYVGLGLVFWGAILMFIRTTRYVKEELLLTATKSSLVSLRQIILELGYSGKGIYLPPKYLNDFELSKVFVSKSSKTVLPLVTQIQDKDTMFIKNPEGLLFTPPGFDLSLLFEETLGVHFTQKDLTFVELNLRKLIVEELEIAQNIQMETSEKLIHVRISNSVYKNMGTLSSAIACILAKTSGNLVVIEKRSAVKDDRIIDLSYRMYESPLS